jgi:hypothetical protein
MGYFKMFRSGYAKLGEVTSGCQVSSGCISLGQVRPCKVILSQVNSG